MATAATLNLSVRDVTGLKTVRIPSLSGEASVGEFVRGLLEKMGLVARDSTGRPVSYRLRVDHDGRSVPNSELVGDALQPGDELTIEPNVAAG